MRRACLVTLFHPNIDHRASFSFCVFPSSENCSLYRQPFVRNMNNHAPFLARYAYSDRVANAPMLHQIVLDQYRRSLDVTLITKSTPYLMLITEIRFLRAKCQPSLSSLKAGT